MLRVLCLDELSALSINVCFYILYMVKVLIILEKNNQTAESGNCSGRCFARARSVSSLLLRVPLATLGGTEYE